MFRQETTSQPLRVGILVSHNQIFEPWELSLFDRLDRNPAISLNAFLVQPHRSRRRRPSAAFCILTAAENAVLMRKHRSDIGLQSRSFDHIPSIPADDLGAAESLDVIISHVPDVYLSLPHGPNGELWEYHFNTDSSGIPEAFGFRETLEGNPVTQTAILRRTAEGARELLCNCITNTKFSASFTACYAKDQLPVLIERELLRKSRGSGRNTANNATATAPVPPPFPEIGLPQVLRYTAKLIVRAARRVTGIALARLGASPDNWSLVVGEGDALHSSLDNLRELPQSAGEFRADPFLFIRGGTRWVFFEAWRGGFNSARICVGRLENDTIEDVTELDLGDVHLSYPYVFEADGETFLIPEAHRRNRVEIWRCTGFPEKWVLHATALEGRSPADTTLIEWDGQWWMFTNLSSGRILDHCMELHVFRVDGPGLQKIEPHPLNPVVLDTTSARNGGRPFVRDSRLIRPAQITSHGQYGYGLKFMAVTELSMENYAEAELRRIEPDRTQATTGCHHVDSCGDLFIMDVRRAYGSKFLGARPIALRAT